MNRLMMKFVLFATTLLGTESPTLAQFEISWYTIDGGGAMSSMGGTFDLAGTIGQPDAQAPPVMTGGTFELTGGFWPVANVCYCLGDLKVGAKFWSLLRINRTALNSCSIGKNVTKGYDSRLSG